MDSSRKNNPDFIYVLGCPRSGTYLLSRVLSQHLSIALPLETHFIPIFGSSLYLWGDLSRLENRARLLDAIYGFLEIWMKKGHREMPFEEALPYSLLATKPSRERMLHESASYGDIVCRLFQEYSKLHGARRWGDKTVIFRHVPIERLEAATPKLKVIHIIRDGRDVCMSWRKTWFGPSNVHEAAHEWVQHVSGNCAWGLRNPTRYCEIRYEDLLENEQSVIRRVADFLGTETLTQSNDDYGNGLASAIAGAASQELLASPIDASNKLKWKTRMDPNERAAFESFARPLLRDLGYEAEPAGNGGASTFGQRARHSLGVFTGALSINNWKRRIKFMLPFVLRVGATLRLNVPGC